MQIIIIIIIITIMTRAGLDKTEKMWSPFLIFSRPSKFSFLSFHLLHWQQRKTLNLRTSGNDSHSWQKFWAKNSENLTLLGGMMVMWVGEAFQKKKAWIGYGGEKEQGTTPYNWNSPFPTLTHCTLCDALTPWTFYIFFLIILPLLKVSQDASSCVWRNIWFLPLFLESLANTREEGWREITLSFRFSPFILWNASKRLLTSCP